MSTKRLANIAAANIFTTQEVYHHTLKGRRLRTRRLRLGSLRYDLYKASISAYLTISTDFSVPSASSSPPRAPQREQNPRYRLHNGLNREVGPGRRGQIAPELSLTEDGSVWSKSHEVESLFFRVRSTHAPERALRGW